MPAHPATDTDTAPPTTVDHVIYHGGCIDGWTAAWLFHRAYPDAEIHAGIYGEPPPDGLDGHVVIADFSYPRDVTLALAGQVDRLTILDHHQTAIENLGFPGVSGLLHGTISYTLDVKHSGAALSLMYLGDFDWLPGTERLVNYVEDRDLWRFALPDSRQISAYINATPLTYDDWDQLAIELEAAPETIVKCGATVMRRNGVLIDQMTNTVRVYTIAGLQVPAVASPYGLGSDTAGILANDPRWPHRIGAYYIDHEDRREFGLRSTDDGPDVAKIAQQYGGGGHPHASGFRVGRDTATLQALLV